MAACKQLIFKAFSHRKVTIGFLLLILLAGCRQPVDLQETLAVAIAGQTFHLELAVTSQARHQGLSDRPQLDAQGGMLFVFPMAREQTFVMRRCLIPIDLIFLDPTGRIIAMHAMKVEPYDRPERLLTRYDSGWPAQFAIELQGGMIQRLGLKIGQHIPLPVEELKRLAQ